VLLLHGTSSALAHFRDSTSTRKRDCITITSDTMTRVSEGTRRVIQLGLEGGTNAYAYVRGIPIRFDDRFGLESFDGRDLGALVPTGARSIGIGGNLGMISVSADTIDGTTARRSNLFPDFGVFVQLCERRTCDAPKNRTRNPFPLSPDGADKNSIFIFPPLRGIGIEFRQDGTQCFLISVGIGSPANQTVQLSPLPDLDFLELF
jgi:hypothetical protein